MIRAAATACLMLCSPAMAADAGLSEAIEQAVQHSPTLDALRARESALRARAAVAGAWPDPVLSVEYSQVPVSTFSLSDHGMAGLQLRAQQTLRPVRWSRMQREVGGLRADAASHSVGEAELRLRASVQQTWWMLARSRLLRGVTERHVAQSEDLLAAARGRYETGAVGQHAVLRLQVLRDRLRDELQDFERDDAQLAAALAEATGATSTWSTPTAVRPLSPPSDQDWSALAEAHRPALMQLGMQRRTAEQSSELARVDGRPDLSVWTGYRIRTVSTVSDPGTDLVAVGVAMPIPSGSTRRASAERLAQLDVASAAALTLEAELDQIEADVQVVLASWRRASEKARTYDETLLPRGRATLETTQAEFSVGRAEFASLFEAEVLLLDLERARIVAAVQTHIERSRLFAALGVEVPGVAP